MPSSVIHRIVGEKVLGKHIAYINPDDIYLYKVGTIAPDSWRNCQKYRDSPLKKIDKRKDSHFQEEGSFVEHYENFIDKYQDKLDDPFMFGYLVHLMTDYYWRIQIKEKYSVGDNPLEDKNKQKKEKDILSSHLSRIYGLNYLREMSEEELKSLPTIDEIEFDGLNKTIEYSNKDLEFNNSRLSIYNENDFVMGIDECSDIIIDELLQRKKHK